MPPGTMAPALVRPGRRVSLKRSTAIRPSIAQQARPGLAHRQIRSLSLFTNILWSADGGLDFAAPLRPVPRGLRAEMDLVIAFSACPRDILPTNGKAGIPVEAHFTVTGEPAGTGGS